MPYDKQSAPRRGSDWLGGLTGGLTGALSRTMTTDTDQDKEHDGSPERDELHQEQPTVKTNTNTNTANPTTVAKTTRVDTTEDDNNMFQQQLATVEQARTTLKLKFKLLHAAKRLAADDESTTTTADLKAAEKAYTTAKKDLEKEVKMAKDLKELLEQSHHVTTWNNARDTRDTRDRTPVN